MHRQLLPVVVSVTTLLVKHLFSRTNKCDFSIFAMKTQAIDTAAAAKADHLLITCPYWPPTNISSHPQPFWCFLIKEKLSGLKPDQEYSKAGHFQNWHHAIAGSQAKNTKFLSWQRTEL
jgi:hypothetical protein